MSQSLKYALIAEPNLKFGSRVRAVNCSDMGIGVEIRKMFNIVLLEPEIPQNTGNIGRTCRAVGAGLHLIRPLGFSVNEKALKRAGLDYWHELDVQIYDAYEDFCERNPNAKVYMATTKGLKRYDEVMYEPDCHIMFGKESAGIPEELLRQNRENCIRIPMLPAIRSLNVSNAAAVVLYEALRQNNFAGLQLAGELHCGGWFE